MKRIIATLLTLLMLLTSALLLTSCDASSNGKDGTVPHVGENGNWWIGDTDTGISAKGETGETGAPGAPGAPGATGAVGDDAEPPLYRYNTYRFCFEISYDNGETWQRVGYLVGEGVRGDGVEEYSFPIGEIPTAGGTITDAQNIFKPTKGWRGRIIDLALLHPAYDTVTLTKNESGLDLGYAFLSGTLVADEIPDYSDGYTHVVWDDSQSVTLTIPQNARYLYVYDFSENDVHIPSSVVFSSSEHSDGRVDPLLGKDTDSYTLPLERLEVLSGAIDETINRYTAIAGQQGALIEIDGTEFNTVTLIKNALGADLAYTFFAGRLHTDCAPTYAAGYTGLVHTSESSVTVKIPENARYLYVHYKSGNTPSVPASITFGKIAVAPKDPNSFTIATWNIGHFSMGEHTYSEVTEGNFFMKQAEYLDFLYNALNADVLTLTEYSTEFIPGVKLTSEALFDQYFYSLEGTQATSGSSRSYSCNAFFSRLRATNREQMSFECNKTAVSHTGAIKPKDYYYLTADVTVNGKTVKVITAHLAYNDDMMPTDEVCLNQMRELIAYCEQFEHVVLLGDWNIRDFSYYEVFTDAGYTLANNDPNLPTYNSSTVYPLDNIIGKGVTFSDFALAGTDLSDHYAIYCTVTVN